MAIRNRDHWNSDEEQRKREQKRIYRELLRQGKPATAQAIEAQLSTDKRDAEHNSLLAMGTVATNVDADSGSLSIDDLKKAYAVQMQQTVTPYNYLYYSTPATQWSFWEEPVQRKELPEQTIVTAIPAWRMWGAPLFGKTLRSVVQSEHKWPIRKRFESECRRRDCAGAYCDCGIYAWKERSRAGDYSQSNKLTEIIGEVWLWGRVLECQLGYRAQYAYPKSFINTGSLAQQYADIYGVPVIATES